MTTSHIIIKSKQYGNYLAVQLPILQYRELWSSTDNYKPNLVEHLVFKDIIASRYLIVYPQNFPYKTLIDCVATHHPELLI